MIILQIQCNTWKFIIMFNNWTRKNVLIQIFYLKSEFIHHFINFLLYEYNSSFCISNNVIKNGKKYNNQFQWFVENYYLQLHKILFINFIVLIVIIVPHYRIDYGNIAFYSFLLITSRTRQNVFSLILL